MSHQRLSMTRRSMLSRTATGLSALAFGQTLLGTTGRAFGAPKQKKPTAKQMADAKAKMAQAADTVPADTKLSAHQQKLAQLLMQKAKHSIALATANPKEKFHAGTLSFVAAGVLAKQKSRRVERAKKRAAKLLADPASGAEANFGAYAKGTLAAAKVEQAPDVKLTAALREFNEAERKRAKAADKPMLGDSYKTLEFHLNSTECFDETSDGGSADEIMIGGQLIKPDGKITTIDQVTLGTDFDAGEIRYHDWELCDTMPAGTPIPSNICPHGSASDVYRGYKLASVDFKAGTYGLVLVLAEQDSGGFEDILEKIYAGIKEEVDAAIEAAGAAAGGAVGSFIPIPGLGTAVGAIIGWIAGKIIEWFLDLFDNQDDLVQAKSWSVTFNKTTQYYVDGLVSNPLPTPNGTRAGVMKKIDFVGDDGHYQTRLHWRAIA